jgi:hypothetical protein
MGFNIGIECHRQAEQGKRTLLCHPCLHTRQQHFDKLKQLSSERCTVGELKRVPRERLTRRMLEEINCASKAHVYGLL